MTRSSGPYHRVAVAELAGQIDLAGDARRPFDEKLADQPGVVRRPAGDQHDAPQTARIDLEPLEIGVVRLQQEPAAQGVGDGARLLVDLLEHEVRIAALLRLRGVPGDRARQPLERLPLDVGDHRLAGGHRDTTSPSSRKITSRVCSRMAGTSEARKVSPLPSPSTSGEAFLAAASSPGCLSEMTTSA